MRFLFFGSKDMTMFFLTILSKLCRLSIDASQIHRTHMAQHPFVTYTYKTFQNDPESFLCKSAHNFLLKYYFHCYLISNQLHPDL